MHVTVPKRERGRGGLYRLVSPPGAKGRWPGLIGGWMGSDGRRTVRVQWYTVPGVGQSSNYLYGRNFAPPKGRRRVAGDVMREWGANMRKKAVPPGRGSHIPGAAVCSSSSELPRQQYEQQRPCSPSVRNVGQPAALRTIFKFKQDTRFFVSTCSPRRARSNYLVA